MLTVHCSFKHQISLICFGVITRALAPCGRGKASCLAALGSLTIIPKVVPLSESTTVFQTVMSAYIYTVAVMMGSFNVTIYGHRIQTVKGLYMACVSYIVLSISCNVTVAPGCLSLAHA